MTYARIGKYSATAPTLSDGETTFLRTNVNGDVFAQLSGSNGQIADDAAHNLMVSLGTKIAGEDTANDRMVVSSNSRKWATDTITFGAGAGAHNANEVMSTDDGEILEFETGLVAGASGIILSSLVTLAAADVFLNQAGYRLHLFTVAPTVIADDAAFSILVAELANYVGFIDISSLTDFTASCAALDIGHNLDFTLADADTKLYGQLVCKGTDTTVNNVVMTINLGIAAL